MTLQALCTRNYASPDVGQAFGLTTDKFCQAKSLTYGPGEEKLTRLALLRVLAKGPTFSRHASTQNLMSTPAEVKLLT